jgi:hypothetical protein
MNYQFVRAPWHHSHQQCWSLQSAFGCCFRPHSCMQVSTFVEKSTLSGCVWI